jgi:hypothetical protein
LRLAIPFKWLVKTERTGPSEIRFWTVPKYAYWKD